MQIFSPRWATGTRGVALAAIQGLNQKLDGSLKQKEKELVGLKDRMAAMERLLNTLVKNADGR